MFSKKNSSFRPKNIQKKTIDQNIYQVKYSSFFFVEKKSAIIKTSSLKNLKDLLKVNLIYFIYTLSIWRINFYFMMKNKTIGLLIQIGVVERYSTLKLIV